MTFFFNDHYFALFLDFLRNGTSQRAGFFCVQVQKFLAHLFLFYTRVPFGDSLCPKNGIKEQRRPPAAKIHR